MLDFSVSHANDAAREGRDLVLKALRRRIFRDLSDEPRDKRQKREDHDEKTDVDVRRSMHRLSLSNFLGTEP